MPVSLYKIATNTATITFPYAGESITVVYYPGRVTERTIAQMQGFASMDESTIVAGFGAFNDTLASLIKSWDVYEDEAQTIMFPVEGVRLAELPIGFRMEVLSAIMGDIRPETVAPQLNGHN